MREFRTYGSVRGAVGNDRPYRDHSPPSFIFSKLVGELTSRSNDLFIATATEMLS